METAAVFLLAMRERAKGRPVRAGTILTVSDVIRRSRRRPGATLGDEAWYDRPRTRSTRRVDLTIGAALTAAAELRPTRPRRPQAGASAASGDERQAELEVREQVLDVLAADGQRG